MDPHWFWSAGSDPGGHKGPSKIVKGKKFFSVLNYFKFLVIKTLDLDPDPH
jgi:hypothetical protein